MIEQPELAARAEPLIGDGDGREPQKLLDVEQLKVYFHEPLTLLGAFGRQREVKVVDDVSFELAPQRTLGIVGESGCGKSTIAKRWRVWSRDRWQSFVFGI